MRISTKKLQELAIFTTVVTGAGVGTMYYLLQKRFSGSEYHRLALQKLEACSLAMESLGAPPLKVYNLRLTDRQNQVDQHWAQIKIPVRGSKSGGYVYASSRRDAADNRWSLKQAVLKLREGQIIDLLNEKAQTDEALEGGEWD
ncbi:cytochrome c oxidase assembly factor 1 homolog [Eucyclogobius newberryi]|uniref:cytochrome c oxidase assembly factor 1 homolog n=1 Tax=Eucyclogobius newberryi TaxID=166745 RepID=UPI003B5986C8